MDEADDALSQQEMAESIDAINGRSRLRVENEELRAEAVEAAARELCAFSGGTDKMAMIEYAHQLREISDEG